jgi:hypothetical protein
MVNRCCLLRLLALAFAALSSAQLTMAQDLHKFPLTDFENRLCRGKGCMQDCNDPVVRQVLAGGIGSIPVLISQLTESRSDQGTFRGLLGLHEFRRHRVHDAY